MIFYLYNTSYINFNYYYEYTIKLINDLKSIKHEISNRLINIKLPILKLDKRIPIYRCRNSL